MNKCWHIYAFLFLALLLAQVPTLFAQQFYDDEVPGQELKEESVQFKSDLSNVPSNCEGPIEVWPLFPSDELFDAPAPEDDGVETEVL